MEFLSRAELLLEQGRIADAEKEIKKHLSEFPEHAYAIAVLARIYIQSGKYNDALTAIDSAIRLDASSGYYYYIKAVILLNQHNDQQAEIFIAFAVNADPDSAEYFAVWADIKLYQKKYAEALVKADEGLRRDPANVHCLNTRASAQVKLNNKNDAYSTIEGALNEDPDNAYTHANYGWGLLEKGEHQKALVHFREALRLDPQMEYAREGMVEAMKAKYMVYRWFLNYQFWMAKQSNKMQWGVIIGLYLLSRVLRVVEETNPALSPYIFPVLILLSMFAFLTWVIQPLSNLFLRLNKYGRYALSPAETKISNFVGISAALCLLGLVLFFSTFTDPFLALAIYGFTMMVPLAGIYSGGEHEKKLNYYALGMAVLGALDLIYIFSGHPVLNSFSTIYFLAFIAYQWLANYWKQGKY